MKIKTILLLLALCMTMGANAQQPANTQSTTEAERMYKLGEDYFLKENYDEAVKWYRKAAAQGQEDAKETLKELFGE